MSGLGESLRQFLSREAGQKRTRKMNEGLSEAMRYYLGPTGIPERMEAMGELNPVNDIYQAGADMNAGNYGSAAVNTIAAMTPMIGAKLAGGGLADDAANVISDTLTGVGMKAQGAMDAGQQFAADEFGGVGPSKGIRAYHGSPQDFDEFSMDAVGQNFSNRASNSGLWFSTNKDDAEFFGPNVYEVRLHGDYAELPSMEEMAESVKRRLKETTNKTDDYGIGPEQSDAAMRAEKFLDYLEITHDPKFFTNVASSNINKVRRQGYGGAVLKGGETVQDVSRAGDHYVVFDENLIEIVRKYGIAGAATMLGMTAAEVEAAISQRKEE